MAVRTGKEAGKNPEVDEVVSEQEPIENTEKEGEATASPDSVIESKENEVQEEQEEQEEPEEPEEVSKESEEKPKKQERKYEQRFKLGCAPNGKCNTAISIGDEKLSIELIDGVYIPEGKPEQIEEIYSVLSKTEGWTYIPKLLSKKAEKEKPKGYLYTVSHPDNTADAKYSGLVSYMLNAKEHKIDCVNGVVKTKDRAVYEALQEKGYNVISMIPLD